MEYTVTFQLAIIISGTNDDHLLQAISLFNKQVSQYQLKSPFVGNGNIEFRGKEANPQINCPIQTIFCSSQTWTISLENVPRAINAMNNHNHQQVVQSADFLLKFLEFFFEISFLNAMNNHNHQPVVQNADLLLRGLIVQTFDLVL